MAYEIKITGYKEPIITENGEGIKSVWEKFIETGKNVVVDFEGFTGKISSIQSFRRVGSSNQKPYSYTEEVHKEYKIEREKILSLPIEERAKRMGFFRLIYDGFTGKHSEDIKIGEIPLEKFVEKIQYDFFSKNPKRLYCDPILFKPLIKSTKCNEWVVPIIERVINQDKFADEHIKNNVVIPKVEDVTVGDISGW